MNIGVFLASLKPTAAAEQRFQGAIFDALRRHCPTHFRFHVLTFEPPDAPPVSDNIAYVKIATREGRWARTASLWKRLVGRYLLALINLSGGNAGRLHAAVLGWMAPEPLYFQQIRDLNLRIIWNLSQQVLHSPVPFIRIIWDVNHRIHSMYPEFSYARYGFDGCEADFPASLARASYVLVGTEEGKHQLVTMYQVHASKIRVIPFPTPALPERIPVQQADTRSVRGMSYIFYPARFWPHKNHVVILHALKILADRWGIRLRCVFSGVDEGNLAYVLRVARELDVHGQVEYLGSVSEAELATLYRRAFALVYASAVGPDNLPPLEAMALGCPVITADVPGAREQYSDAALFFAPTNEEQLALRLKDLFDNSALRQNLIDRGARRAASWTSEDYVKSVMGILEEFALTARAWERCDSKFT